MYIEKRTELTQITQYRVYRKSARVETLAAIHGVALSILSRATCELQEHEKSALFHLVRRAHTLAFKLDSLR